MTLQQVKRLALKLPLASRVKLMTALAKSLENETLHACPPGVFSDADPNFMEIIYARLDAYERGEVKTIPWEEIRAKMEARIHRRARVPKK